MNTITEKEPASLIEHRRDVPSALDGRWAKSKIRNPKSVDTLGAHHTAVAGGFGVSRRLLKKHNGDEFSARLSRYSGQPYHAIFSPQDQASIVQWPGWMETWHGNGMNRYTIGWGLDMDCRYSSLDPDQENIERMILGGLHVVGYYRDRGFPLEYIETHSQHSRKDKDPCPWVMREVLVPLARMANMTIRAEATSGHGKPWDRAQIDSWIQEHDASQR